MARIARKETHVQRIVHLTAERFPSFYDLLSLSYAPPRFKEEVDIEQVVRFVLAKRNAIESARRKKNDPGNDTRDISMISELLKPLPNKSLDTIQHLKQRELRQQLRNKARPFSRLSKETREKLLHLPISWVREGAKWQLNSRRPAILLLR